jgi:hypothetical protein
VIFWKDFVFDQFLGPHLVLPDEDRSRKTPGMGASQSIKEDAIEQSEDIRETGQEQQPARMVGLSGSDSNRSSMEADSDQLSRLLRWRGET